MSRFPSLPLFTDAFIADTVHLNAAETGAYLMLLMVAWRSPECRLPDDDQKLARWARIDLRYWPKTKKAVMEFWTLKGGYWTQARLLKEHSYVTQKAAVARENGKHGGRPKSLEKLNGENPAGSSRVTQTKAPNPIKKEDTLEADASNGAEAPSDPSASERDLFIRGRKVLGSDAGGLIAKLLRSKGGNVALARADIERASQADIPREFIGRVLSPTPFPRRQEGSNVSSTRGSVTEILRAQIEAEILRDPEGARLCLEPLRVLS